MDGRGVLGVDPNLIGDGEADRRTGHDGFVAMTK